MKEEERGVKKKIVIGEAITPIVSQDGSQMLDLRPSEWKALMRSTWRSLQREPSTEKLYNREVAYFGGVLVSHSVAAPIRFQAKLKELVNEKREVMLLHRERSFKKKAYSYGTSFEYVFRYQPHMVDLSVVDTYVELFELSLLLGGIGLRSRRGRGAVSPKRIVEGKERDVLIGETAEEVAEEILQKIIRIDRDAPFERNETIIYRTVNDASRVKYPVLEKIEVGQPIGDDVTSFLKRVDQTSHHVKKHAEKNGLPGNCGFLTGEGGKWRFSSSLVITLVRSGMNIYPLYVQLRAVKGNRVLNVSPERDDRIEFINQLEGRKSIWKNN